MRETVHLRRARGDRAAPCGYVFDPRLRGFDFEDADAPPTPGRPIDCVDCFMFAKARKRRGPKSAEPKKVEGVFSGASFARKKWR